jgi:hypothetical protein
VRDTEGVFFLREEPYIQRVSQNHPAQKKALLTQDILSLDGELNVSTAIRQLSSKNQNSGTGLSKTRYI